MSIISNYYTAQDEILNQLNKEYEQYLNKKVRIILNVKGKTPDREYAKVIYEGIDSKNGFLYLKYRCIKKDGTPSKNTGSVILFFYNNLEFHLIDE